MWVWKSFGSVLHEWRRAKQLCSASLLPAVGELGGLWSEVVTVAVVIVRNSFGVLVAVDCI